MGDSSVDGRQALFKRSLTIEFTGEAITSDAGVTLLREVDDAFDLTKDVAATVDDPRISTRVGHALLEILRQRVYAIACGYPDALDAARLRHDPVHALAVTDHPEQPLASQPTLSRLEREILAEEHNLSVLAAAHPAWFARLASPSEQENSIVDFDSTDDPVHGEQEGAADNGYYKEKCFHPLFAFSAKGWCLGAQLRPAMSPPPRGWRSSPRGFSRESAHARNACEFGRIRPLRGPRSSNSSTTAGSST
jgi:hypothetical protein